MTRERPHVRVVTVATHPRDPSGKFGDVQLLKHSCAADGREALVLGAGCEWKGNATKLRVLLEHLEDVPEETVVLFVDAYDTILLPCRDELVEKFLSFGTPMVFGAEKACWPDRHLSFRYPRPPAREVVSENRLVPALRPAPPVRSPFPFLNSGTYMGYAGAIRDAIRELAPRGDESDQRLFTRYFLEHPGRISLDYWATLFQNLYRVTPDDLEIERDNPVRLKNRLTGSRPCVLHGNGPGKGCFVKMVDRLRTLNWP